jgi:hypothetical protein
VYYNIYGNAAAAPDDYLLTPYNPELERQLELGREIFRDHRDTLRALVK